MRCPMHTVYTVLIQGLIPESSYKVTEDEESAPFPKTGRNSSRTSKKSSALQINDRYLSIHSFFSTSAAEMISSEQIRSSIVTEKYLEISFRESRFGYPRPDSHFEIAVLETKRASASSSCVRDLLFLNSCSFSLNSIFTPGVQLFTLFPLPIYKHSPFSSINRTEDR